MCYDFLYGWNIGFDLHKYGWASLAFRSLPWPQFLQNFSSLQQRFPLRWQLGLTYLVPHTGYRFLMGGCWNNTLHLWSLFMFITRWKRNFSSKHGGAQSGTVKAQLQPKNLFLYRMKKGKNLWRERTVEDIENL